MWLRCQATDSSEQSQRASCEPLTAVVEREDNCLGTQHPALTPAGSRGRAGSHDFSADKPIAHRHSTRNEKSHAVAVFLEPSAKREIQGRV